MVKSSQHVIRKLAMRVAPKISTPTVPMQWVYMMPSRPCLQSARAFIQLQLTSAMTLIRKKGSDQSNRLASSGQPHRSPISNVGRTWHFLNTVNLIQQKPQQRCEPPSMDRVAHHRMPYIVRIASGSFLYSAEILSVVASGRKHISLSFSEIGGCSHTPSRPRFTRNSSR